MNGCQVSSTVESTDDFVLFMICSRYGTEYSICKALLASGILSLTLNSETGGPVQLDVFEFFIES